ncbi:hypothetical protein KSF_085280 [Reticulibacter mediterranei]|uniref:TIR domain-containing protein n=1 Tax=Reticulibacter mediterranei TaxID=2778369 RepID=A0A8J3ITX7_9CHLR|nr:hypothetical protein KSF_085280 [Reticulibacter mediterranei]
MKQELEKHLKILLDQHLVTFWSHDQIQPGNETAQVIQRQFFSASVLLLLLSPDYFSSDQCQHEMEQAIERQYSGTARVFLILGRPCSWEMETRLQRLPVLPEHTEPVILWRNRDQAWLSIVRTLCQRFHLQASVFSARRPAIFEARDLPAGYVARPVEFNAVKRLLLSETGMRTPVAITTALHGAGGFGKTTLALALCHDPDIQTTFADGILWITLGETPPNPLSLLNALVTSLTKKHANYITLEQAVARLRSLLLYRSYLIVLDDVWEGVDLTPFLEGGPHCVRLITTRNTSVLPDSSKRVFVDTMREKEAIQLLCQGLPASLQKPPYVVTLSAIVKDLGEWPLLLTLANSTLKEWLNSNQSFSNALADLHDDYKADGIVAFDKANTNQRHQAVERCLTASLRLLSREEALRYQELSIFPEDADIPLATVGKLWQVTGGLDQRKVKKLCLRLFSLSLLVSCDLRTQTIRLHDVLRNYLQQMATAHVTSFHHAFLNAYHLPTWGDLSLEEPYLWKHLFFHLKAADRIPELLIIAHNFHYLTKKAFLLGSHTIEIDLQEAITLAPHDQSLMLLHTRIAQIGHLMNYDDVLSNTQCLFLSYLCDLEHYREQCAILEKHIEGVYVKACYTLATSFPSMFYRTLSVHMEAVNGCTISADGKFIVSASDDPTLIIWSRENGEIVRTLRGHTDKVNGCAISADGKFIVSASDDCTLRVWNRENGEIVHTLQRHTAKVNGCAISADGRWIVSASDDRTLRVWNRENGEVVRTLQRHTAKVNGCAISADGKFIVSVSDDCTLRVWNRENGEIVRTLRGHTAKINGCAISADGKFIVSASDDCTLRVWNRENGEVVRTFDETLRVWNREEEIWHILEEHTDKVNGCAISADGRWIVSVSDDRTLRVWNRRIGVGEVVHIWEEEYTTGRVTGCAISADGRWIVSASWIGPLMIWDREPREIMRTLQRHTSSVNGCAISADGRWIVSASWDGTLKIWNRENGEVVRTLPGHTASVNGCAISADGKFIVSASDDHTLKIWNRENGEIVRTLRGHTDRVNGCAISADGKFIVSASSDHTLKIWNRENGEVVRTLQGHTRWVQACTISANGRWIVSASWDGTLKIWNRETEEVVRTLQGHTASVNGCAISADGKFIVSASDDRTLKIWNRKTGTVVHTLRGHTGEATRCAISADGRWIVSSSSDNTLKVWEMQSGRCLCTLALETYYLDICFSSASPYFVASGEDVYFFELVQGNTSMLSTW